MSKTVCVLFLTGFGMVCYLPPLCAEEKVQVPGTVEDATGAAEVTEEKVTEEITVSARARDPLAAQRNASAVQLDGDLLRSLPARALRRLRLHRLTRTLPGGFTSEHPVAADAQHAGEVEICYALIAAARRWYANSACRDAQVQANLALLALLH